MASINELKSRIDLHDLAEKLGLERPDQRGNYRSPQHDDKSPSLSVYADGKRWKDHSTGEGGTCVDLVMYVRGIENVGEAIKLLHELYGIPPDPPSKSARPAPRLSRIEWLADQCLPQAERAIEYLTGRAIAEDVVRRAIERRAVGFNSWTRPGGEKGTHGYGGDAVAFIVQSLNPGQALGVDFRYLDPELNGGTKTQTQGEKAAVWFSDHRALERARTVYVVESPINVLSVDTAKVPGACAVATRGTGTVHGIDWRFLVGKRVLICMDNDEPDDKGRCAGASAAWDLHARLTAMQISVHLVDQGEWEHNDVNDILADQGAEELRMILKRIEPWAIPGRSGKFDQIKGRPRVYLPAFDAAHYWRYRNHEDFTTVITTHRNKDGDEQEKPTDVAGFRVAGISRVTIADATSTMSGEKDMAPRTLFSCAVQAPRHGNRLIRRVFEDERLHNVDQWRKFGPIFSQAHFLRLINILERAADIGARHAVNFVGLCWRDGKPVVNEGPDCYFTEPEKQCPYHNLVMPAGTPHEARLVISAFQRTFQHNAAALVLVWGLGAHLKAFLGFWPHMILEANKGAGKSTLVKRLERAIAMIMFAGESTESQFRLLTSTSHTSHPVGWEEISARKQEIIDRAVSLLQQAYQYSLTRRGSEMTEYLVSAPVLLAGEDVPVRSLLGKVVRTDLSGRKGPLMPQDLPVFPVRSWLDYLVGYSRPEIQAMYDRAREGLAKRCSASEYDDGAMRMVGNYAAVLTAWRLLCDFASIGEDQGEFIPNLVEEMNSHLLETGADREPWVWITEILLSEIAADRFKHPYVWARIYPSGDESSESEECLCVRTSHVIDHIAHSSYLREKWSGLPIKSDRAYKKQLNAAGMVVDLVERTVGKRRISYMAALGIGRLAEYGLHASPDVAQLDMPAEPSSF